MIYTVTWKPAAQNDLANIWMAAPDRLAVTQSADRIDAILRTDPYTFSESRSGPARIMFVVPLAVAFEVNESDCLVTVTAIWRIA
jgi:hypothetical protein